MSIREQINDALEDSRRRADARMRLDIDSLDKALDTYASNLPQKLATLLRGIRESAWQKPDSQIGDEFKKCTYFEQLILPYTPALEISPASLARLPGYQKLLDFISKPENDICLNVTVEELSDTNKDCVVRLMLDHKGSYRESTFRSHQGVITKLNGTPEHDGTPRVGGLVRRPGH